MFCEKCGAEIRERGSFCTQCGAELDTEYGISDAEAESLNGKPQYLDSGSVLQERYRICSVVGAGGFGVTYEAWDLVLEQKVAIKEYMPGEFSTRAPGQTKLTIYGGEKTEQFKSGKDKFYEESKRLAKFQEVPGIVQIYNSFQENQTAYIVMEFLKGETLAERMKREKMLPEQEALSYILPALEALEIVHKEGILHRDISPNNIFLTRSGGVKILDFGAARSVTGTHSKSLTVLYKEGYTAEEQYRSRGDQGPWTDVYSCAATLYHMLTGIVPPGSLERRRKDTLKKPSCYQKISDQTEKAVMNALNVEIKHRTQSAEQLIKELTGKMKVKEHFVRTIEKKTGKIPSGIKAGCGAAAFAMILFLALLFTGVIHFDTRGFGNFLVPEGKTRVPNLISQDVEEAKKVLEERRLVFQITDKEYSDEIPKDKILMQSVEAGSITDVNTMVQTVVSGGKEKTDENTLSENEAVVPDIQYKSLDEAEQLLEKAGLNGQAEAGTSDTVEVGKIIEQLEEAGSIVERGSTVTFYVNSGGVLRDEELQAEAAEDVKPDNEQNDNNNPVMENPDESIIDYYYENADSLYSSGNVEEAISMYEEGYEETGDYGLQMKAEALKAELMSQSVKPVISAETIESYQNPYLIYTGQELSIYGIVIDNNQKYAGKKSEYEAKYGNVTMSPYGLELTNGMTVEVEWNQEKSGISRADLSGYISGDMVGHLVKLTGSFDLISKTEHGWDGGSEKWEAGDLYVTYWSDGVNEALDYYFHPNGNCTFYVMSAEIIQ